MYKFNLSEFESIYLHLNDDGTYDIDFHNDSENGSQYSISFNRAHIHFIGEKLVVNLALTGSHKVIGFEFEKQDN